MEPRPQGPLGIRSQLLLRGTPANSVTRRLLGSKPVGASAIKPRSPFGSSPNLPNNAPSVGNAEKCVGKDHPTKKGAYKHRLQSAVAFGSQYRSPCCWTCAVPTQVRSTWCWTGLLNSSSAFRWRFAMRSSADTERSQK